MKQDKISPREDEQKRTTEAKKRMIEAMEKSFGVITTACKSAGVGRTAFHKWMNEDPLFKKAIDELDCENIALDFAESKLYKHINDNDRTCLIFYLKTKGKKRGYIERVEHTGADGAAMQLNIVVNDTATKDALDKL